MVVTLVFHREQAGDTSVWWVDSPEMPGFYATRPDLDAARVAAEAAVREILDEQGDTVTFVPVIADEVSSV